MASIGLDVFSHRPFPAFNRAPDAKSHHCLALSYKTVPHMMERDQEEDEANQCEEPCDEQGAEGELAPI